MQAQRNNREGALRTCLQAVLVSGIPEREKVGAAVAGSGPERGDSRW